MPGPVGASDGGSRACVVWVDDGWVIQEWVDAERLGPVPALERQMPGNPNYFSRVAMPWPGGPA